MYLMIQSLLGIGAVINALLFGRAVIIAHQAPEITELHVMLLVVNLVPMVLCIAAFAINRKSTIRRRMTILITDVTKLARGLKDEREKDAM